MIQISREIRQGINKTSASIVVRLVLLSLSLLGVRQSFAQSAAITSTPSVVIVNPGQLGSTKITWSGLRSNYFVFVSCNGGAEALFASSGDQTTSSSTAPWISIGSLCEFRLRNSLNGPILAKTIVEGKGPSSTPKNFSISATPSRVVGIEAGQGTSRIAWDGPSGQPYFITVSCGDNQEQIFANTGGPGFQDAPWIGRESVCEFRLRTDSISAPVVATTRVYGASRGGTNHNFYYYPDDSRDSFYNYGIVLHYHEGQVRNIVRNQLRMMHANGQRSLRVMVYFAHSPGAPSTSTPAESSRKCSLNMSPCPTENQYFLPPQFKRNLRDYLSDIKATGFERVVVAMGPQWVNSFWHCNLPGVKKAFGPMLEFGLDGKPKSPFVMELFEEAWGVIRESRAIVRSSGLDYLLDLGNEMMGARPGSQCARNLLDGTPNFKGYLSYIWGRYVETYGNGRAPNDTVGFSVIMTGAWDAEKRFARMPQFLNPLPKLFSFHTYSLGAKNGNNINEGLKRAFEIGQKFEGGVRPWIIGEADSPKGAMGIQQFIASRPEQRILNILQWPLPGKDCGNQEQCLRFDAFLSRGL
jgi:hypothetical protein